MKLQVSQRQIINNYHSVICVGYADLQNLLAYEDARYYSAGVYGWNADLYEVPNTSRIIVTGYRPYGNVEAYKVREYEQKAKQFFEEHLFRCESFTEKQAALRELIKEWSDLCIAHHAFIQYTLASLKGNRRIKAADRREHAEKLWDDLYDREGLQGVWKMYRDDVWEV